MCECYEQNPDGWDAFIHGVSASVVNAVMENSEEMCEEMRAQLIAKVVAGLCFAHEVRHGRVDPDTRLGMSETVAVVGGYMDKMLGDSKSALQELVFKSADVPVSGGGYARN